MIRAVFRLVPLALFTVAAIPLQLAALRFGWKVQGQLPVLWHRLACRCIGIKITVEGTMHRGRPLLLVPNHSSWLDIVVLGALAPASFVAKSEVGTWPLFSTLARLQRTIFVDRQSRAKTGQTTAEMASRMRGGDAVVLFAEGTSSDGLHVLPFRSALIGAATAAIGGGGSLVHVQPVAVTFTGVNGLPVGRFERPKLYWIGDMDLVPHLLDVLQLGAVDVTVAFLAPLVMDAASDRKAVAKILETRVRDAVARLACGRP